MQPLNRTYEAKTSTYCSLSSILAGLRIAEIGKDTVAHKLLDKTAEPRGKEGFVLDVLSPKPTRCKGCQRLLRKLLKSRDCLSSQSRTSLPPKLKRAIMRNRASSLW
jgi:hypothetical protein